MSLFFAGKVSPKLDTKLEAFAHQVRTFAAAKDAAREPRTWFESLWHRTAAVAPNGGCPSWASKAANSGGGLCSSRHRAPS